MKPKYTLKLYTLGKSSRSIRASENIRRILQEKFNSDYDLSVIDILENPDIAEAEKILATPTLIREYPLPKIRIIGDLSVKENILKGLDIEPPREVF